MFFSPNMHMHMDRICLRKIDYIQPPYDEVKILNFQSKSIGTIRVSDFTVV